MDNATFDVVSVTKELIKTKSESQHSNAKIADLLQTILSELGFVVERLRYADQNGVDKACLVAKAGTGKGGFGIFAHSDTVPGMERTWQPYVPSIEDNRLTGRGSCDMKGPIAAALAAISQLPLDQLRSPLYFVVSADEELHYAGAYTILANSRTLADSWPQYGVVIEPTRLQPVHGHKGGIRIRVVAEGIAAHSSTGTGISANFLIAPFLAEMSELAKLFKTDRRYQNQEFDPPDNAFNMVLDDGGCAPNVTAARTVCTLALRPMPNDHHEEAVRMIRDAATRHGLVSAAFMFPVVYNDPASEVVRAAIDVTGAKCSQTVSFGTEAAVYKDHCQLVILGPGDIAQAHTVGEWIDIDQLRSAVDVYARMISQFCL